MNKRIALLMAVLMCALPWAASAQLRCQLGGTNSTANACTDNAFLMGAASNANFREEVPSGTCDSSSFLRFDSAAADGSRLSCAAGGAGMTSFDIDGDNNSPQTITNGNEALFVGGAGVDTTAAPTDQITFDFDATELTALTWSAGGSASFTHTYNITTGTDPTMTFAANQFTTPNQLFLDNGNASINPLIIEGAASQTANLIETRDSATNPLFRVLASGGIIFNESSLAADPGADMRAESDTLAYAFHLDSTLNTVNLLSNTDIADTDFLLHLNNVTRAVTASEEGNVVRIVPSLTEAASGTHPLLAGVRISQPTFTNGAGATTDAATLYIGGAPTGITPVGLNSAIYVAGGAVRVNDGQTVLNNSTGAGTTPLIVQNTTSTGTSFNVLSLRGPTAITHANNDQLFMEYLLETDGGLTALGAEYVRVTDVASASLDSAWRMDLYDDNTLATRIEVNNPAGSAPQFQSHVALVVDTVTGDSSVQLPAGSINSTEISTIAGSDLATDGATEAELEGFLSGAATNIFTNADAAGGFDVTNTQTECVMLEASSITCSNTSGCVDPADIDGTNFSYKQATFSNTGTPVGSWTFSLPQNFAGTTAVVRFHWLGNDATCDNTATRDVCWTIDGDSFIDSDLFNTGVLAGTLAAVTDRCITNGDILTSPDLTFTHSMVASTAGARAVVQVGRSSTACAGGSGDNDYAQPARLIGVEFCYETNNIFSGEN